MRSLTDVFAPGATTIPEGLRTLVVSPERELEPGMTLRASFRFRNQGGATATGVRVRFNLPEGLVYLVGSGKVDGKVFDDEHGTSALLSRAGAEIGDVEPGEERSIEIAYSVAGAIENGSAIEIQAAVAAFELAPVGSNIVRLIARSRPSLENPQTLLKIEPRGAFAGAGTEATVTLRVHNAGESSARDLIAAVPIPEHTTYVPNSARVNGRELERDLLAPFDDVYAPMIAQVLPAGATVTLLYRVRIDDPLEDLTPIQPVALVASQETRAFEIKAPPLAVHSAPNFAGEQTIFATQPGEEIAPGATTTLQLVVVNEGSATANDIAVSFELPPELQLVKGSARLDERPLRERKKEPASFDIGSIPPRDRAQFHVDAIAAFPLVDAADLSIRAGLQWNGGEREFQRALTVRSLPYFSPRASAIRRKGALTVGPSDEVQADIAIANHGTAAATDALLQLAAGAGLDDIAVLQENTPLELRGSDVELGDIAAYASKTLSVRARVSTPMPDRSVLTLAALLHTQELGETPLGEVEWRVQSHPAFSAETSALRLAQDDVFRPNQLVDVYVTLRNEGTDVAHNVRLLLFVSPEARLESVEGATRDRVTLLFGDIAPAATAEARLGVRLLRSLAKAYPVTIDAVVAADGLLHTQLDPLTIVTSAEPNFGIGMLQSEPADVVSAGEEIAFALHVRNSGDGPARSVRLRIETLADLIYVPNSTTVNEVPVRDGGAMSPLMNERGLALSDVDPGVEATIRWREVVHNSSASGAAIVRSATIAYDGDRIDTIAGKEVKVRCEPAFANSIAGLPFGLDGMLGPSLGGGGRVLSAGKHVMALPAAAPVARSNGHTHASEEGTIDVVLAFDDARLTRALRYLRETRFSVLVDHLFAIRAFFPQSIGSSDPAALREFSETLRETLDRLFIKMRLPNYVLAPRDIETPSARERLLALGASLHPGECAYDGGSALSLRGTVDAAEMRMHFDRLADAPTPSAQAWAVLARLLPSDVAEMSRYRERLIASLDDLASVGEAAFVETLQQRRYPVLDAALEELREQIVSQPA